MGMIPWTAFNPLASKLVAFPATRGPMSPAGVGFTLAQQRLSSDSIGGTTVTLTNVVPGSA